MKSLKYIFCIFYLILIVKPNYSQSVIYQQGDTLVLIIDDIKWGNITWQRSKDLSTWIDIPEGNKNSFKIIPDSTSFYRAMITEESCNPIYTDTVRVELKCFVCGDTLIDSRDNQKYPTILIGDQCWMAKNLNVGKIINTSNSQINNDTIEKYCYNNDPDMCEKFGGLYTWDETMQYTIIESSQGVCPVGWHVPSEDEWKILERALGMDSLLVEQINIWRGENIGTAMKEGGSSGYNALLSGRFGGGVFAYINQYEFMHSSTLYESYYAWRRCLRYGDNSVGRWNTFPRSYSLSVRCVKND